MERFDAFMARVSAGHAPDLVALDITMAQLKVLYLVGTQGPLHVTAIADRLGVTLSTGSGLVDRLVEHGLLERRHDDIDRRHVSVSVSPAGAALMERTRELNSQRMRALVAALSEEDLAALVRILDTFIDRMPTQTPSRAR
jgi:DNA-binding MarR family transcriptional regulator